MNEITKEEYVKISQLKKKSFALAEIFDNVTSDYDIHKLDQDKYEEYIKEINAAFDELKDKYKSLMKKYKEKHYTITPEERQRRKEHMLYIRTLRK